MSRRHTGSSVDNFLKEAGIFEEAQAQAIKEVVAWQLAEAMKKKKISKNKMAALLKTSRSQVERLLSATDDITLSISTSSCHRRPSGLNRTDLGAVDLLYTVSRRHHARCSRPCTITAWSRAGILIPTHCTRLTPATVRHHIQ